MVALAERICPMEQNLVEFSCATSGSQVRVVKTAARRELLARTRRFCQRTFCCVVFVVLSMIGFTPLIAQEENLVVTIDNFIDFINSPPAIDTIVFKRSLAFYPMAFESEDEARKYLDEYRSGKIETNSEEEMFALRHLPDRQFIVQYIRSVNDAWNGSVRLRMFNGMDKSGWWMINPGGKMYTDSIDTIKFSEMFLVGYRQASEILCLGMYWIDPDTIQKDDVTNSKDGEIRFSALVRKDVGDFKITGVAVSVGDLIGRIHYSYVPDAINGIEGREILLSYDRGNLSHIAVYNNYKETRSGIEKSLYADYEIIKYIPASFPYSEGFCGAEQFMSDNEGSILFTGHDERYDMTNPDNPRFITDPSGMFKDTISRLFGFLILSVFFTGGILFWYSRNKRSARRPDR